ncbi:TetR/AcrR family transcriptional regulator [Paenibacillus sp. MAH-36]
MLEKNLRKDAEKRRQVILEKAAALFAEYGVEHVSMRQIAREAGVGQGTLYRSYNNKGELCWDLIGESCIQNYDRIQSFLGDHTSSPIKDRLETVLLYHLESLETHSPVLAAIQANSGGDEQQNVPFYSEHYESIHSVIVQLLNEVAKNTENLDLDPVFTADAIMAILRPDVYIFQRQHRGYSPEEIKNKLFHVFIEPLFHK